MHRSYPLAFLLVRGLLCNPNGAYANQSLLIVFEHRINDRCWTKRSSLGNKGFLSTFLDGRYTLCTRCRKRCLKERIF